VSTAAESGKTRGRLGLNHQTHLRLLHRSHRTTL
jgi:hypothetical protein